MIWGVLKMRDPQFTMGFNTKMVYNLFLDDFGVLPFILAYFHLQPQ